MSTRQSITIESGTLLALGAIGLWGGLSSYFGMDARMQSSWLKPGVYVSVLSAGLMLTALIYGYLALRATPPSPRKTITEPQEAGSGGKVLAVFGIVVLYAFLIPIIDYLPATLFFLFAQFRILGVRSWRLNALISIGVTALFYVVFIHYGGLEFPHGGLFD